MVGVRVSACRRAIKPAERAGLRRQLLYLGAVIPCLGIKVVQGEGIKWNHLLVKSIWASAVTGLGAIAINSCKLSRSW